MSTSLSDLLEKQKGEAVGPVNKWYCSQYHGYEVTDPETLITYYIKHGGASHFRKVHETQITPSIKNDTGVQRNA